MGNNNIDKKNLNQERNNKNKIPPPEITVDLAHELETPLTVVKETLQLISNGSCGPVTAQQHELLDLSEQSISRLIRLVSGMLDSSKIESEKTKFKKNNINIDQLLDKIIKKYKKYFVDKNISMEYIISLETPVVRANEDSLTQVFINLLSNSIKYTSPGGRTQIFITETNSATCFEVFNTGNWIPEDMQDKIFNKYFQLNSQSNGSGLGLSIVKDIIESHNGKIWVESDPIKGTAFKFKLPK